MRSVSATCASAAKDGWQQVQIAPFVETRALDDINEVFAAVHRHEIRKRVVLVP